jgi:hypothetical protein
MHSGLINSCTLPLRYILFLSPPLLVITYIDIVQVFTWLTIDSVDYLVLYALKGQSIEVAIPGSANPTKTGSSTLFARLVSGNVIVSGTTSGIATVTVGKNLKIIVLDKQTALTSWNPPLSPSGYNVTPQTPSVFVIGSYLVRNATLTSRDSILEINGDTTTEGDIQILAPASVHSLKWNGRSVPLSTTELGTKRATLGFKYTALEKSLPSLSKAQWKCTDSLPEIRTNYDDRDWTVANKNTTTRPLKPYAGQVRISSAILTWELK